MIKIPNIQGKVFFLWIFEAFVLLYIFCCSVILFYTFFIGSKFLSGSFFLQAGWRSLECLISFPFGLGSCATIEGLSTQKCLVWRIEIFLLNRLFLDRFFSILKFGRIFLPQNKPFQMEILSKNILYVDDPTLFPWTKAVPFYSTLFYEFSLLFDIGKVLVLISETFYSLDIGKVISMSRYRPF